MNPAYAGARRSFDENTSEHVMTVLHDEGLYRHLRFAQPGTGIFHFDIITWPGHLTISGDMGDGWSFGRIEDMFNFFRAGREPHRINPSYWWQKMPHQLRDAAKKYSAEEFRSIVKERAAEMREELSPTQRASFTAVFNREVLRFADEEHEAREALDVFEYEIGEDEDNPARTLRFADNWDYDYQDWDFHFLWALFAIVHGIELYRAWKQAPAAPDNQQHTPEA